MEEAQIKQTIKILNNILIHKKNLEKAIVAQKERIDDWGNSLELLEKIEQQLSELRKLYIQAQKLRSFSMMEKLCYNLLEVNHQLLMVDKGFQIMLKQQDELFIKFKL